MKVSSIRNGIVKNRKRFEKANPNGKRLLRNQRAIAAVAAAVRLVMMISKNVKNKRSKENIKVNIAKMQPHRKVMV